MQSFALIYKKLQKWILKMMDKKKLNNQFLKIAYLVKFKRFLKKRDLMIKQVNKTKLMNKGIKENY